MAVPVKPRTQKGKFNLVKETKPATFTDLASINPTYQASEYHLSKMMGCDNSFFVCFFSSNINYFSLILSHLRMTSVLYDILYLLYASHISIAKFS